MTPTQPYTVPIIAGDLRRAELVKQYADTFEYLDSVSQDMFNRIAIRLNVYRAQLNKFDERIQHANAHIERIKGSKRAIQVHSSARYPVEQKRSSYKSIFECDTDKDEQKPPVLHYNSFRLNETIDKFIDPNDKGSKSNDDTLVILKQYENNFIQKTKRNVLVGLGKPPANIKSVVSFLKYNTQENPYTQPTKIDPLSVGGRVRKQVVESTGPRLSETPAPAFYKPISERQSGGGLSYNPSLGLVPELSLPDNLTELGNFATFDDNADIGWTKQQMTSIAPSYAISMLPDINDLSSTTTTAPPAQTPKQTVPAPPPVDIPAIIPLTSASTTAPPPAPPPPPAPALPPTLPSVLAPPPGPGESQTSMNNPPPLGGGGGDDDDDGGNPLLAEIRNFGKKKQLKSAVKTDRLDAAPSPAPKAEENIMDSLKARLQQRRRFINGETAASSSSAAASADKPIAAPTPPPVASTGGAFTDAIAAKAQEVAAVKQRQKDDSDNDSDDNEEDWE